MFWLLQALPKLFLVESGKEASLLSDSGRFRHPRQIEPIVMDDVRALILHAAVHDDIKWFPRWCRLVRPGKARHCVFTVVEGMGVDSYRLLKGLKQFMDSWADLQVEVMTPMKYGSSALDDLCRDMISKTAKKRMLECENSF